MRVNKKEFFMAERIEPDNKNEKKGKKSIFGKNFFSFLDKSVEVSKKGIKSAGEAITTFGDKSVTKIETTQLHSKVTKLYTELGEYVAQKIVGKKNITISSSDEKVAEIILELQNLQEKIKKNEIVLEKSEVPMSSSESVVFNPPALDDVKSIASVEQKKTTTKKAVSKSSTAKKDSTASKKKSATEKAAPKKAAAKTSSSKTSSAKTSTKKSSSAVASTKKATSKTSSTRTTKVKSSDKSPAKKTTTKPKTTKKKAD